MRHLPACSVLLLGLLVALAGCDNHDNDEPNTPVTDPAPTPADESSVYAAANRCNAISIGDSGAFLVAADSGTSYEVQAVNAESATRFLMRPADLGIFLLYDENEHYLTSDGNSLSRKSALAFDTREVDGQIIIEDRLQSEGEWELTAAPGGLFTLRNLGADAYLSAAGILTGESDAAELELVEQIGCAQFPELSVDASGNISMTEFADGDVYGFVDAHSHLFTNFAFGGGGVFHGAPFHRLGVEHALEDCDLVHGEGGRKDFMGSAFGGAAGSLADLLPALIAGELPVDDHDTRGYPDFTAWPDAHRSATHQVQYYTWLQRAYLSGLRLVVQHATTNQGLCQLATGIGAQPNRFDCNDMVAVDRILEETYALERYVDALAGGPGQGWFRIVFSPEEARAVIKTGKLAVVLGIETSDLFDCFLVPFGEFGKCSEADVVARLDAYHDKGVRALFPVHKYDNAFSAGDGHRGIIEIGNFLHTGHLGNLVQCEESLLEFPGGFDSGGVTFPNFNQPRDVFDSTPPFDMSGFEADASGHLIANIGLFLGNPLPGEYCQNHGLTGLGEFLITEMMQRGMILEVDHFPRRSYAEAYELMLANDYPGAGTHGRNNNGLLYQLGGVSKFNFGRCRKPGTPATMDDGFQQRLQLKRDKGAYAAEGFGFDLNGFAGSPGPRFGDNSVCAETQTDAGVSYPFTSFAGDITLQQPEVGNRILDFNTEGMVHLGLVAELIEDVRRDGVSDEDLEPLFRSAEAYLRMWEKSELRGAQLRD